MMQALKRWAEYCRQNDFAMLATMIALAFAMSLLAGCANSESQPVVTDDDLTPISTVQEVIEQEAGNGKTYEYSWPGEEQDADPIVSPQEAANRAGQVMEEMYGLDLTGQTLLLHYEAHEGDENARPNWEIWSPELLGPERDPSYMDLWIDATTGEIVSIMYVMGENERAEYLKTPVSSGHVPLNNDPDGVAGWDTSDPEFDKIVEHAKEQALTALSGSVLTGGCQVTGVEFEPETRMEYPYAISLKVTCKNGKFYYLTQMGHALFYPEYDCSGYPLRAFNILVSEHDH